LGNERKFDPVDDRKESQNKLQNEWFIFLSPGQSLCQQPR